MIRHYFKIALRNLWKYKTQNFISVIGLAVGLLCLVFVCIAAVLWKLQTIALLIMPA